MNNRQIQLMELLQQKKEWMKGKDLAEMLEVSPRTIRSDVEAIHEEYKQILIDSNSHYGYRIKQEALVSIPEKNKSIPQTSSERSMFVIKKLFFEKNEMSLTSLQEELCVGEATIENDIKKMRKMIQAYPELELSRSKYYISIVGNESSKRKLYKDLLTSETNGNFMNLNRLSEMFEEFDLLRMKDILLEVFHRHNFKVREMGFPILMLHIGISIGRMLRRNYVCYDVPEELKQCKEYQIAKEFYEEIRKELSVILVEDEVLQLTNLLIGRNNTPVSVNDIPVDAVQLIEDLVEDIDAVFGVDFRHDEELKLGLQTHIISLIKRVEHATVIDNILLLDIKKNYPMVFEISVHVSGFVQKKLGITINENEIGFLALHIGVAYERGNMNKKYRAVLILPVGKSLSTLCCSKIESKFAGRLEIISIMNYYEENNIEQLCPDIILTSIPFEHESFIPVYPISIFLSPADEGVIFNALNELDKAKMNFDFFTKITRIMNPDFFYDQLDVQTPEEVIKIISEDMIDANVVADGFKESVLEREKLSSTSIFYSIATPHAFGVDIHQSTISIALLKEPIQWGNFKVKLVFLLAVHDKDTDVLRLFFEWLSFTINHPKNFTKLLEVKDYDEFILELMG